MFSTNQKIKNETRHLSTSKVNYIKREREREKTRRY